MRDAAHDVELAGNVEVSQAHCSKCGIMITEGCAARQKGKIYHLACVNYNRRGGWDLCKVRVSAEDSRDFG